MNTGQVKKSRKPNRVLWITSFVIGITVIGGILFFYRLNKEASEVESLVSQFMASIADGNFQGAYDVTSLDFRARNSSESFENSIKQLPAYFSDFKTQNIQNFSKESGPDFPLEFDYRGSVHYKDKSEGVVEALLIREGSALKIYSIYFDVPKERLQVFGQKEMLFGIDQNSADRLSIEFSAVRILQSSKVIKDNNSAPSAMFLANQLQSRIPIPSTDAEYKTTSSGEGIITFYDNELARNGWSYKCMVPIKDWGRDLGGWERIYVKDGYLVALQYAGSAEAEYGWRYSLDFTWSTPGKLCAQ